MPSNPRINPRKNGPDTDCVHAGAEALPEAFGLNTPIITSSAFDYRDGKVRYPRYHNGLNHEVVARRVAALEGGEEALITASGMGAISAIFLSLMKPGDHAILLDGLYGGTTDLVEGLLKPLGFEFSIWDGDPAALASHQRAATKLVWVESPTNPLMNVIDLRTVAGFAKQNDLFSVIDSTFATPILQQPLQLGFDLVMHSATKYFGGHSDLLAGAVIGSGDLISRLRPNIIRLGSSLNGEDLYLLERSIKTLALRVRRQSDTAFELATWLSTHPGIEQVFYPGLPEHPGHCFAQRQMLGFGGMMSFRLHQALDAERFLDTLRIIQPAISLAGVESTVCQPLHTSHAKLTEAERQRLGIDARLMRLSVGIEAIDDLKADLEHALS
ncbi:MAG: PLP-dependent aspartate aminotransferase family protein [Wenzhouxiangella sp.]|nr:PLP-dependent aspartate aminotransferase family protein [Wenzhouxiangella sp.]